MVLPKLEKGDDVFEFLVDVDEYFEARRVPMENAHLYMPYMFRGEMLSWYRLYGTSIAPDQGETTYEAVVAELINTFGRRKKYRVENAYVRHRMYSPKETKGSMDISPCKGVRKCGNPERKPLKRKMSRQEQVGNKRMRSEIMESATSVPETRASGNSEKEVQARREDVEVNGCIEIPVNSCEEAEANGDMQNEASSRTESTDSGEVAGETSSQVESKLRSCQESRARGSIEIKASDRVKMDTRDSVEDDEKRVNVELMGKPYSESRMGRKELFHPPAAVRSKRPHRQVQGRALGIPHGKTVLRCRPPRARWRRKAETPNIGMYSLSGSCQQSKVMLNLFFCACKAAELICIYVYSRVCVPGRHKKSEVVNRKK